MRGRTGRWSGSPRTSAPTNVGASVRARVCVEQSTEDKPAEEQVCVRARVCVVCVGGGDVLGGPYQ